MIQRRFMLWLLYVCMLGCFSLQYIACDPKIPSESTTESTSEKGSQDAGESGNVDASVPQDKKSAQDTDSPDASDEKGHTEPISEPFVPDAVIDVAPERQPELQPEPQPDTGPSMQHVAWTTNTNYAKGSISLMSVTQRQKLREIQQVQTSGDIAGDVIVRKIGDQIFVLNRFNNAKKKDRVDIFDAQKATFVRSIELVEKANPHDVAVYKGRIFISQYGLSSLLIVGPGQTRQDLDMAKYAEKSAKSCSKDSECSKFGEGSKKCNLTTQTCESDGVPEMSAMHVEGTKLYILVQGLDRNDGFKPVQSSIAILDLQTTKWVKSVSLKGQNPTAFIPEPSGSLLIVEQGSSFDPKDGGLERFDPKTGTLSGQYVFEEKDVDGTFSFSDFVIVSKTLAYAIVNDATYKQSLITWNPTTGAVIKTLLSKKKLGGLAVNSKGELYLGDLGDGQGGGTIGVRIFEAQTGKELTTQPISVSSSLAPKGFVFTQTLIP